MAFIDDVVINLTNQVIDWSATTANTFYTVRTAYSYFQDAFDELGGVALAGAMAFPTPMSAATPQDVTVKDGWYLTQGSTKRTSGGSIQTDGYDGKIYLMTLNSGGYTSAIVGDKYKVVTGGTSGATGRLLDYNNTTRQWWVRRVTGTFVNNEALTIGSGTGAGTTATSSGVVTGEEGFANAFGLGTVEHWGGTYFEQNSAVLDPVADGWYSSAPTAAFDLLFKIRQAGSLIGSGVVVVYNRCNYSLANSINSATVGDTYDWFSVDLSGFGRNPVPLNTRPDTVDTIADATAANYLNGTTASIAFATAGAPYNVDVDQDGTTEAYGGQINQSSQTNTILWAAAAKYFFRKGATDTIAGVQAQLYRTLNSSYAQTKDSPIGTIAGGTIFFARGWVPINVATADASRYQVITTAGVQKNPPVFYIRAVTGLTSGQKVFLARRSAVGFALTSEFTLASGNNSGNSTLVVSTSIPVDKPTTGFIRVFRNTGAEDRYAYTSWTGSTFTLSGTLSTTYAAGNSAYVPFIDETASGSSISKPLRYISDRDVVLFVRLGSGLGKMVPFASNFTLSSSDSAVPATVIADAINNN